MWLLTSPSSPLTKIELPLFRVLQRRLRLPLPLSERICRCGHFERLLWLLEVLGRRGDLLLEGAAARVCREAGGRVAANLFVHNMDLGLPRAGDNKRLEVVVDGLPLFGGAQLATPRWSLHSRAMENQGEEPQIMVESHWQQFAETRKEHTLSWSDLVHAHDWWFSLGKWAADGPRKPRSLCGCWHPLVRNHFMCRSNFI